MQVAIEIFGGHAHQDVALSSGGLDPGAGTVEADVALFGVALKPSAYAPCGDVAASAFRVDPGRFTDRNITGVRRGRHFAGFHDGDRPPRFNVRHGAGDITYRHASRCCMKFGITSDVADVDRAGALQFGVTADVAGFDRAPLSGDVRVAFDVSRRYRTAACPQDDVSINITDVDVPAASFEVEIDIFGSDYFQNAAAALPVYSALSFVQFSRTCAPSA